MAFGNQTGNLEGYTDEVIPQYRDTGNPDAQVLAGTCLLKNQVIHCIVTL
jgi:hypothetical protein